MNETGWVEAETDGKKLTAAQRRERMANEMQYLHSLLDGVQRVFAVKIPATGRNPRWRLYVIRNDKDGMAEMKEITHAVHRSAEWRWDDTRYALVGDPYTTFDARDLQSWLNKTWGDLEVAKV